MAGDRGRGPYALILETPPCDHGLGARWGVIGPDGIMEAEVFLVRELARERVEMLNRAYQEGRNSRD